MRMGSSSANTGLGFASSSARAPLTLLDTSRTFFANALLLPSGERLEVVRDAVGVEVADTEHLEAEIAQAIREIEGEDDPAASDWSGWRLNVVTEEGGVLVSIALD